MMIALGAGIAFLAQRNWVGSAVMLGLFLVMMIVSTFQFSGTQRVFTQDPASKNRNMEEPFKMQTATEFCESANPAYSADPISRELQLKLKNSTRCRQLLGLATLRQ